MYIQPSTNITILKDVPIDSKYSNTLYFASESEQTAYFNSKTKYTLTNQTFQRVNKNVCRVQISAENLNDCNYLMFRNTGFSNNKRYYAFIESVDYVNNETSDITYTIDVMQTYMFDVSVVGFVEREHTLSDSIGSNILPEPVNCGEYVYNDYQWVLDMREMCVIIAIVDTSSSVDGTLYDGIYGSAELWVYASSDVQNINSKISDYLQSPDSILSIYMCPLALIGEIPNTHKLTYGASALGHDITLSKISTDETLDGYKPKNNKLYTYPYNFLCVDNASGGTLSLRYEYFASLTPKLSIDGTITMPVCAVLRPSNYKGSGGSTLNTESLQLSNYPQCSWNNDAFQAWIAQQGVPTLIQTAGNVGIGAVNGAISGGFVGATVGGVSGVMSLISQGYQASISADVSKGTFNNGGANVASFKQNFYYGRVSINSNYARMIDNFFSRYGYNVSSLKVPNKHARENYTYTKTREVTVKGDAPASALEQIANVYNNGITFWVNPNHVGHYNIANDPITN